MHNRIGYIGVDILNNATICNETTALLERDVPLELVSVYKYEKPTFYKNKSLSLLDGRIHHLYPMKWWRVLFCLVAAPFLFRRRFFLALSNALFGEVEGFSQRLKMVGHLIPGVLLAMHWRKKEVTHIHAQWAHTAATIAMHSATLMGVGFSFMGHANDLFVHRVALREKVRRARFVLCISEYHRRFYLDLGAAPDRLHVVYCGISLERFRDQQSFNAESTKIVSIGRLVEKKGFDDLIRACGVLRERGLDFECIIAGSGPEEASLRQLVLSLNLEDRVSITGEAILQEDIPQLLRSARVFALPCVKDSDGDMDGLPQVLIEAMACRVPCVATYLVGIPDLIRHEEGGLLVETKDYRATANAIQRIFDDSLFANRLATRGESWAKEHFSRDDLATRLQRILGWAANTPGNHSPTWVLKPAPGSPDCYDNPQYSSSHGQQELQEAAV